MRLTVIFNAASGSAAADARRGAEEAIAAASLDADIVCPEAADIVRVAERAAADGRGLVAAGGDGTVSSVASVAVRSSCAFGVIPMGTLNHFARDVGIPADVTEAVRVLASGRIQPLDVGEVNGRFFLNNASLGFYPRIVREREREQRRGRPKWMAFAVGLGRAWVRYRTLAVQMDVDGVPLVRRTPFVFVGNGRYEAEGLKIGSREAVDAGHLSLYLAPECGRFEMLALSVRALAGRLTPEVKLEALSACEVTIETARRDVSVALDGELHVTRPPIRCRIHRGALHTLVP